MHLSLLVFRFTLLFAVLLALYSVLSVVPFWPKGDAGDLLFMVLMAVVVHYLSRLLDHLSRRYRFLSWV